MIVFEFDKLRWGFKFFPAGIHTEAGYYATVEMPDELKWDARFEPLRVDRFTQQAKKLMKDMEINDVFIRYVDYFQYLEIRFDNAEDYATVKLIYQ